MLKGYAVNKRRLESLEKTVKLIDIAHRSNESISGNEAKDILEVINKYSKALELLDDYRRIKKVVGDKNNLVITYDEWLKIITKLRFYNKSTLFALEKDKSFELII